MNRRPNGRFAELNVGATKRHVKDRLTAFRFVHSPENATDQYEADPSHSDIVGLPQGDSPEAALIGDMIAECIATVHPALS